MISSLNFERYEMHETKIFVYAVYRVIDGKYGGLTEFCYARKEDAIAFCKSATSLPHGFEYFVEKLEVM